MGQGRVHVPDGDDAQHAGDALALGHGVGEPPEDCADLALERDQAFVAGHRFEPVYEHHPWRRSFLRRLLQQVEQAFGLEDQVEAHLAQ